MSRFIFKIGRVIIVSYQDLKDNTTSSPIGCSCSSRDLFCVHEDDGRTGTRGHSDRVEDVLVYFHFSGTFLLISSRKGLTLERRTEPTWPELMTLPEIPYWFVWEEGLLRTDLRSQTLQQTDFCPLLLIVESQKGDVSLLNSTVFYFLWILFEVAEPWHAKKAARIKSRYCCKIPF